MDGVAVCASLETVEMERGRLSACLSLPLVGRVGEGSFFAEYSA